jgi:hypothetical protein
VNIKFTQKDGMTYDGFRWPLPTKNADGTWTPGKWTRKITGKLELCENGYHFTDDSWCAAWVDAEMYEIEIIVKIVTSDDTPVKHICRRARLLRRIETWNEKTQRLLAVRIARDAMTHIKNPDPRSLAAIDTAEKFANGDATKDELDAAWAAARDSARDAAWAAAWAAARQKYSAWLMEAVTV